LAATQVPIERLTATTKAIANIWARRVAGGCNSYDPRRCSRRTEL